MKLLFTLLIFFTFSNVSAQKLNLLNKDSLTKQLLTYKWSNKEKAKQLIRNNIIAEIATDLPKIGDSKIGGTPDLPCAIKWPLYKDSAMVFIAQYNLAELSKYDVEGILPKTGFLYFFEYFPAPEKEDWGSDYFWSPRHEKYKILYYDGDLNSLEITSFPKSLYEKYKLKAQNITFKSSFQIVDDYSICYESIGLDSTDAIVYNEFYNTYQGFIRDEEITILGCSNPVQYDVTIDWLLSYDGFCEINDLTKLNMNKYNKDLKRRSSFVKLFEFDMLTIPNVYIGESKLYIGIQKEDLERKYFDNSILIHQGT